MRQAIRITEFGAKLELLLRSGKTKFRRVSEIAKAIDGISADYFSRIKGGSRQLTEHVFVRVVQLTSDSGLSERDWYDTLNSFGHKLGFSIQEIQRITGSTTYGIDFHSRSRDHHNITSVHGIIEGFWESFYYSVSTFDVPRISRDLVIVNSVDESGCIGCKVVDGSSVYVGSCFPTQGPHLYFMLEKDKIFDEIIVYMMNRPERVKEPLLNGIILCSSGGVQDMIAVPSAARVAFRYLGKNIEAVKKAIPGFKLKRGQGLEEALIETIPGYLDPRDITRENQRYYEAKRVIDNEIVSSQIPFALRMERWNEPIKSRPRRKKD